MGPFGWLGAAMLLVAPSPGVAQVLPPPALPGQDALGRRLADALETKDVTAYAALLSDHVRVFEDERQVAGSKAEWLTTFGRRLSAEGVTFRIEAGYSSTGRILFIEQVNSTASWGGAVPAHCCWSHDAVAYDIAGGKVSVIRRLRGGDTVLDPPGTPRR